jgi:hypothetical protein
MQVAYAPPPPLPPSSLWATDAPPDMLVQSPTQAPTISPTQAPSISPTDLPTTGPTRGPTTAPSTLPTRSPTQAPTTFPSKSPTSLPTFGRWSQDLSSSSGGNAQGRLVADSPHLRPDHGANHHPDKGPDQGPHTITNGGKRHAVC